jgi:hypothetical protein
MLKAGKIFLGKHAVSCTVRNLSETGACVQVQTTEGLPSEFSFSMADQPSRRCKVIWRTDTQMGLQFQT